LAQKEAATAAPESSAAPKGLRYGIDDLREVAKDPGHPLADFVGQKLNKREPLPSIWADAASEYVELGYHANAWAIQKAMLRQFVSGELALQDDALNRLLKGVTALPERFRTWASIETETFSFFDGRQTSARSAESLRQMISTLDRIGQNEKALSLAGRFVTAYPDDIIGAEALNALPASAALYRQIASEQKGKRAGAMAQLRLGETYVRQDKLPDAVAAYKEYLHIYPEGFEAAEALRALAGLCERMRDYQGAIECSEKLLTRLAGRDAIAVMTRIAAFDQALGHHKEYVAVYAAVAEKYGLWNPTDAARAILGGAEYAQEHDWANEAAELYDSCIRVVAQANSLPLDKLPRSEAPAAERLAFWKACLNVADDDKTVSPAITAFVQKNPRCRETAYARYVLCRLAMGAGKIQEAMDQAEALTALLPDAPEAQRLAGEVRAKTEGFGQAEMAERASSGDLSSRTDTSAMNSGVEAVYRAAQSHARAGRNAEAVANFSALAEEWPESPLAARALFDKAEICRDALNDPARAQATLERLVVLYPETDLGVKALQLLGKAAPLSTPRTDEK
jgi:outer membrane protein assembly factor BamD (BamD/ComL family)